MELKKKIKFLKEQFYVPSDFQTLVKDLEGIITIIKGDLDINCDFGDLDEL